MKLCLKILLVTAALGLVLLLPGAALAQSQVTFDASRHLAGFDEAEFSEFNYLYDFESFKSRSGETMAPDALEAVRTEWDAERARVRAEIDKIEASPTLGSLHLLERQLKHHRFFSKLRFRRDLAHDPIVLYLQELENPHPRYFEKMAERYAPVLKRLVDMFEKEYARPLGLAPREGHTAWVLFVLSSWGDYANYTGGVAFRGFTTNGAYYDPDLRAAVTFEDAFGQKEPEDVKQRSALFATAHSLLHAHRTFSEPPAGFAWLFDGIAENLSRPLQDGPDFEHGALSAGALKDIGAMLRVPEQRNAFALTAGDLLSVAVQPDARKMIEPRALQLKPPVTSWWGRGVALYQKQAGVFVRFLQEGADGRFRQPFNDLLKKAMTVEKPASGAGRMPFGLEITDLHEEYVNFLAGKLREHCPDAALRREDREGFLAREGAGAAVMAGAAAATAFKASRFVDPDFRPEKLKPGALPAEASLGLALHEARAGRFKSALVSIGDVLAASKPGSVLAGLAARNAERLEALIALRRDYLDSLAASGRKVRLEVAGENLVGSVKALEAEAFLFEPANGPERSVPVHALDAEQLMKLVRDRKLLAGREHVLGCAALVAGSGSWRKYARGDSPEEAALRGDADLITEHLDRTALLAAMLDLSRTPLPESAAEAERILATIRAVFEEHGESPELETYRNGLHQFAAHAFGRIFDESDLEKRAAEVLKGKFELLQNGDVRVTYEFEDAAELEDFTAEDYLEEQHETVAPIQTAAEDTYFEISKGKLVCRGKGCRRMKVFLKAPLAVTYELFYSTKGFEKGKMLPAGWFSVCFCDDGYGSCIQCVALGHLDAFDKRTGFRESHFNEEGYTADTRYTIKVIHDGTTVQSHLDGVQTHSIPCGPLVRGGTFLWIHEDVEVRLGRIEMEGAPDPEFLMRLRDEWILDRVASIDE